MEGERGDVSDAWQQLETVGPVALAMLLGGLIGLDREFAGKPAGLRTHMLVAGAASLLVAMGDVVVRGFDEELLSKVQSDPIRIIQAVVTGLSFLGAGTIIRGDGNGQVEGLTTAASILLTGAIGICVALSQVVLAIAVTLLVLLVLQGVGRWERRLAKTAETNG